MFKKAARGADVSDKDDVPKAWINSLRNYPAITVIVVVATILGAVTAFFSDVKDLLSAFQSESSPKIAAFTLSTSAFGFEEKDQPLFGASEKTYRTFQPQHPFRESPAAVFLVTVSNPTKTDLQITSVVYDVHEVGEVRGGTAGPLVSLATYHHRIEHEAGEQTRRLIPPFGIPSGQAASFELEVTSSTLGSGLGWYMRIGFVSSAGTLYTEDFQLFLPETDPNAPVPSASLTEDRPGQTGDLLSRSMEGTRLPEVALRDCLFKKAGVFDAVQGLDQFDRDMLYLRAASAPLSEFKKMETETSPPVAYRDLLSPDAMTKLMTLLKSRSRAGCSTEQLVDSE
ncbi:hypothetical protein I6F15_11615 [Bradyrhizobium sp. BRP14]|nr:hypothetical protein [Bradyrhizobium sp. BRP14]